MAVGRADGAVRPRRIAPLEGGAGAAPGVGVVLHHAVERPARVPVDAGAQHDVGQAALGGRAAGQHHLLAREAVALRQPQPHHLGAAFWVEQARGQAAGDEVVVDDAVVAGKGVLGPDGGEVEVVGARVVVGQQALVAVRRVDVHQARLQRLAKAAAEVLRVALEHQAAVEAEGGQHAAGRGAAVGQRAVELVAGGVQLHLGHQKTPRTRDGPRQLRVQEAAVGVGLLRPEAVGTKAREVAVHRVVEAAVVHAAPARGQLRQTVVGRDDGRVHVLQRLPLQCPRAGREIAARPGQRAVVGQQARGQRQAAAREVAPVVVVAHAVQVQPQAHGADAVDAGVVGAVVAREVAPAVAAVAQLVIGQQVGVQAAAVVAFEVAELATHLDAAAQHDGRREGGVAVGRDVPVIRHRQVEPALVVEPDGGRQPAGLAPLAERKAHGRHRQDGHALELQHRAFGPALVVLAVQLQLVGAQDPVGHPVRPAALAGGVGALGHAGAVAVQQVQPLGRAVRAAGQEAVGGLQQKTGHRVDLDLPRGGGVAVALGVHAHVAGDGGDVGGLVIHQLVGAGHAAGLAQLGLAFDDGFKIGAATDAVAVDDGGRVGVVGQLLGQQRRGLQLQRLGRLRQHRARQQRQHRGGHRPQHGGPCGMRSVARKGENRRSLHCVWVQKAQALARCGRRLAL